MVAGSAVAGFAIGRANTVSVLRDLGGGPIKFVQRRNQAGNDAGLAYVSRVAADDDQSHTKSNCLALASHSEGADAGATFWPDALASPTALNIAATAAREFPRRRRLSLSKSCWAECRLVRPP